MSGFANKMSREDKIKIIEQAISIEGHDSKQEAVFTSFYAQDLITFGIENKIGEAVRLGEQMLS